MVSLNSSIDVIPVPVANGGTSLATLTAHALYVGNGTSAPSAVAVGTTGQVLSANSSADPTWKSLAALNIVDDSTGTVGSPTTLVINTTYLADQASVTNGFLLPASGNRGDQISIQGVGPGGWQIQQNANQSIKGEGQTTTTGTGGTLSSMFHSDSVTLTCVVGGASTVWNISNSNGTLYFV